MAKGLGNINIASPADSDQESSVASNIRDFKECVKTPMQVEHTNAGIHSKLTLFAHVVKSVDYEVLAADVGTMFISDNATPITFTLPAANSVASGKYFLFRKISSGSTVTIEANSGSDYINGGASTVMSTQYTMLMLISDGINDWALADISGKAASAAESRLIKTADESVVSTTALFADTHLLFAVGANENWLFDAVLFYTSALGIPYGIRFDFTIPSGASGYYMYISGPKRNINTGIHVNNGYGQTLTYADPHNPVGAVTGLTTIGGSYASATGEYNWVRISGSILNGATAGNVQLRWSQMTSIGTNLTVLAGSSLSAKRA